MKKAEGFVTDDGVFFEDKLEAFLYEEELRLRNKLSIEFPNLSQEGFMAIVMTVKSELRSYINAHDAADTAKRDHAEDRAEANDSEEYLWDEVRVTQSEEQGHVVGAEEDLAALLKLPRKVERDTGMGGAVQRKQRRKGKVT